MNIKQILKNIFPKKLLNLRHLFFAWLGSVIYGRPSEKLLVIGVTGTSGKSSTVYFLKQMLEQIGFRVGALSTIEFCVAGECRLNDKKMTMLGKMAIQKYLRQMVKAGCGVAIIETTSEGAVQHRHRFINYDMMILTNLYPEHIESHGSFYNYKAAKLGIFEYVSKCRRKDLQQTKNLQERKTQKQDMISKTCIVNADSEYANEFLKFNFDQKFSFGKSPDHLTTRPPDHFFVKDIFVDQSGLSFLVSNKNFHASLYGEYNVMNITIAVAVARSLNINLDKIQRVVAEFHGVPGRIEFIQEAEACGFQVIVDYAFEPVAMAELYKVVDLLKPRKIIHVFGSTGGGRDISRRETIGKFVGERADICIITDEDPYDDNPQKIIDDVAVVVEDTGKTLNKDLFKVLDRGGAIKKAIELAGAGDLVLITGKGSEQAMAIRGKLIPYDDRMEARKALEIFNF